MKAGLVAGAALGLSLALHGAVLLATTGAPAPEIAGGNAGGQAALGTGFADLAAGTLTPVTPPTEAVEPVAPLTEAVEPVAPAPAEAPPDAAAQAQSTPPPIAAPVVPAVAAPVAPAPEVVTALDPELAVSTAPRPPARPRPRAPEASPARPEASPARPEPAPQGNSDRDQQQGTQTARAEGTDASEGRAEATAQDGTAAASSYPGEVLRQLSRQRRERLRASGTARVAFAVDAGGGVASVSIVQSSGVPEIDAAAVNHVARAAPFPPPPPGAQTRFTFDYGSG